MENDAAEYVLGTLPMAERLAFAQRCSVDPAARGAVASWERRLEGLAARLPPVVPPRTVWHEVEKAIGRRVEGGPDLRLVQGVARTADLVPQLRRSARRWRVATIVSGSLAAALAVVVGGRELYPRPPADSYVAAINPGGDKPAMLVRVDLQTQRITIMPVAAQAPAGKSLQLWYIGAGRPPRSMGLVAQAASSTPLPADVRADSATFAVSVEPQGGSKVSGPSGPVAYSGQLIKE